MPDTAEHDSAEFVGIGSRGGTYTAPSRETRRKIFVSFEKIRSLLWISALSV